ncbi:MAG: hypothetical protein GY797_39420 [Deltaproteobacteria bacterium]|nr:hypothetical protein [Deltaproteobacteria bacterium]
MVKKAKKKVCKKLIGLTKQYFDSLVNSDYDGIYEELITNKSANLLSATAWALICYKGDNLDFLIKSEYAPNPEIPVHDALSMAFQMDIEECRTGLFSGLAEATLRQQWQNFNPKDLLCFVDNGAAILIASSPTIPVLMPFVKQDGEYLIDFEALWLFSMNMRASILSEIASYAHQQGNNDLAAEFFTIASNLALPYQRIMHLMIKNPFVGQIITPKRKQEIICNTAKVGR